MADVDEALSSSSLLSLPDSDNVEAWKEVHAVLLEAVRREQEAVQMLQVQRRYWLEELVANLQQGKLAATSVWRKPIPLKKSAGGSSSATGKKAAGKRKKAATTWRTKITHETMGAMFICNNTTFFGVFFHCQRHRISTSNK